MLSAYTPENSRYAAILHDCFYVPFKTIEETAFHECAIRKFAEDRNQAEEIRVRNISNLKEVLSNEGLEVILSQNDLPSENGEEIIRYSCVVKIDPNAKAFLDKMNEE